MDVLAAAVSPKPVVINLAFISGLSHDKKISSITANAMYIGNVIAIFASELKVFFLLTKNATIRERKLDKQLTIKKPKPPAATSDLNIHQ